MFWMHRRIRFPQVPVLFVALVGIAVSTTITASALSLADVEELALASDPGVQSVQSNRLALEEMSVAAEQLPDPLVKMGFMSLPTDTFNLGQEA